MQKYFHQQPELHLTTLTFIITRSHDDYLGLSLLSLRTGVLSKIQATLLPKEINMQNAKNKESQAWENEKVNPETKRNSGDGRWQINRILIKYLKTALTSSWTHWNRCTVFVVAKWKHKRKSVLRELVLQYILKHYRNLASRNWFLWAFIYLKMQVYSVLTFLWWSFSRFVQIRMELQNFVFYGKLANIANKLINTSFKWYICIILFYKVWML